MKWLGAIAALTIAGVILLDAFEAVILPRRVRHGYRLAPLFYQATWIVWRLVAKQFPAGQWRNGFLSVFGPLSLFGLLSVWAAGLIVSFGLFHWSLGTALSLPDESNDSVATYLYFSGTTFFTLGYGDVVPTGSLGRALSVVESGVGFAFLAIVISYLPILYQAFSRREITISLLDARAGSPPTAAELLRRLADCRNLDRLNPMLVEWERWSAELLESHLSFPVVSYYRSQHDNQSWVGCLTAILDTSAILIAGVDGRDTHQARLTFAMARHAAVDLGLVFQILPLPPASDRLPPADFQRLQELLRHSGLELRDGITMAESLAELRGLYEPFVNTLATYFQFMMPPFQPDKPPVDNWQRSPRMHRSPGLTNLPGANTADLLSDDEIH
jgi:hypothetical protein